MIIPVKEETFDKIQQPLMIKKKLYKIYIKRTFLNKMKFFFHKATDNIFQVKNGNHFPLTSSTRQGCPFLQLFYNIVLEVFAVLNVIHFGKE